MTTNTTTTNSAKETIEAGKSFSKRLEPNSTVHLRGEMGAGKTHFVKGMALGLGIESVITSPTFALVNSYESENSTLHHFDLFRLHSEDDLYAIGFYDYIGKGVLVIEWAENIPELENEFEAYHKVEITKIDDNTREIKFEMTGIQSAGQALHPSPAGERTDASVGGY